MGTLSSLCTWMKAPFAARFGIFLNLAQDLANPTADLLPNRQRSTLTMKSFTVFGVLGIAALAITGVAANAVPEAGKLVGLVFDEPG